MREPMAYGYIITRFAPNQYYIIYTSVKFGSSFNLSKYRVEPVKHTKVCEIIIILR